MVPKKKRTAKKMIIAVLAILIILALATLFIQYKKVTFAKGFAKIQEIESEYNGDFRNEQVNNTKIKLEDFDSFIKDLEDYKNIIAEKKNTTDIEALVQFTDARILLLKSEKFFKMGNQIGDVGKVKDGFRCSEINYILNTAYFFNRSWTNGVSGLSKIDDVLNYYRKVPQLWNLVGIDDNKTRFYKSDLKEVKHISITNVYAMEKYCDYDPRKPLYVHPLEMVESSKEKANNKNKVQMLLPKENMK